MLQEQSETEFQRQQNEIRVQSNKDYLDKIAAQEAEDAARKKRNRDFAIEMAQSGLSTIQTLTELFGKKSERAARNAFRINKGAQIASATMATYQSATQAYASQFVPVPDPSSPIRGAVAAGAAVFAGLANVAKIASQKFEGGGSSGDENDLQTGIHAVSVVHSPAIEENFIALSKHEIELKEVDAEKKILMGAALVPNKQILRADKDGNGYYIYFSEDTIKKASELFLMRSNQNNATYEHKEKLNGMSVVESWVIDNPEMDKSKEYGFSLPKGTWMIAMKVNNEDIWKDVKAGKVKGFSIEGYFADKYEMSQEKQDIINQLKELLK